MSVGRIMACSMSSDYACLWCDSSTIHGSSHEGNTTKMWSGYFWEHLLNNIWFQISFQCRMLFLAIGFVLQLLLPLHWKCQELVLSANPKRRVNISKAHLWMHQTKNMEKLANWSRLYYILVQVYVCICLLWKSSLLDIKSKPIQKLPEIMISLRLISRYFTIKFKLRFASNKNELSWYINVYRA